MSVESWARRASGLLVPTMGFANHPLGRFQPCVGPCCPPSNCTDCVSDDDILPASLWVDIPELTDVGTFECIGCGAPIQNTYEVVGVGCEWESAPVTMQCLHGTRDHWVNVEVLYDSKNQTCEIRVKLTLGNPTWWIYWAQVFVSTVDPIDFPSIPFDSEFANILCSGVGTTVAVYE